MVSTAVQATLGTIGGIVGLALIAWPVAIWWEVDVKCEKPKYTLLKTLGSRKRWFGLRSTHAAEVRMYAPYLLAEVTVEGGSSMREALGTGFRNIAGFIFGKNVAPGGEGAEKVAMTSPVTLEMSSQQPASAKIAMTSPVTAEMAGDGSYKVAFVMPSKYTKETLPRPVNDRVVIKEMPSRTLAALSWNGRSPRDEEEVDAHYQQLLKLLKQAGLEPTGPRHLWQYHPPFAMSWQRVNEVLVEVKGGAAAVQATNA